MILQQLLTEMALSKQFWNLRSSPNDECFFSTFVDHVSIVLILTISLLISRVLEVSHLTESFLESFGFQAVRSNSDEIHIVVFENLLEVLFVFIVLLLFLYLTWSWFLYLSTFSLSWFSRWNDVQEILVVKQVSILIHNSNCGHEVSIVDLVHDGTHDYESLSLWNDVFFDESSSFIYLFQLRIFDFEPSSVNDVLIFHTTLIKHEVLRILF
jgi:hypothetical protein